MLSGGHSGLDSLSYRNRSSLQPLPIDGRKGGTSRLIHPSPLQFRHLTVDSLGCSPLHRDARCLTPPRPVGDT